MKKKSYLCKLNFSFDMKKTFLVILAAVTLMLTAEAQVVLVDKYQPLGSKKGLRDLTTSKDGMKLKMACYKMGSGFGLVAPGSGLIGTTDPTVVQFDINGEYSRLTFVLAPFFPNSAGDGNYSIVTIKGDDRVLMDEVVFDHDALRMFSLDVKGVHILKFTVLQGGQNVGYIEDGECHVGAGLILGAFAAELEELL